MSTQFCLGRRIFPFLVVWIVLPIFTALDLGKAKAQPPRQDITAEEVEKVVQATIKFLFQNQQRDGGWPEFSIGHQYQRGVSCLAALALLNAGVEPEDPRMAKALNFINDRELQHVYTVSLQTMALCTANPRKYAKRIQDNAVWLIKAQQADGGWAYDIQKHGNSDESNSQFALLALHEAQRSGVVNFKKQEIWETVFSRSLDYWSRNQLASGAFGYRGSQQARGSMTCAGIASLIIAGSQTNGRESSVGATINCCGQEDSTNDRIERALEELGRMFSVRSNPGMTSNYYYYYMYALERVGRLTGRRYIVGRTAHDWYREGADYLINAKHNIGGQFQASRQQDGNNIVDSSFALLFLAKGKRKIVVSRLQYPSVEKDDWNHHSMGVQNLTSHTEQVWKRVLAWQTVDIELSNLQDLLQSPVLFISGSRTPRFTQQQKLLLKEYVDAGGFIFAEGCNGDGCNGTEFEDYFRKLVVELWDKPLEALPPDHPIWYAEGKVQPDGLPDRDANIYGVQTCCRLGVIYVPYSLSCRWELNAPYGAKPKYNEKIRKDLDTATLIGVNVLSYATGKELKEKLDAVTILEDVDSQTPTERGVFTLPKLQHNAGYDDATQSITNLVQWFNKSRPFRMSSERKIIPITKEGLQNHPIVYMHGRGELILSTEQREALKEFFENDGFLFADAICADEVFAESFRREIEIILGEELENAPASHPMFTDKFTGEIIRDLQVIDPNQAGDTLAAATRRIPPRLEIAKKNGRVAVVFSPLDLSCALESKHSLQCKGYFRDDAAKLSINVLLFALLQ
ncbi:MAG: DUF4159 domain-containing protein [Planctomycetota bacterium]